MNFIQGEDIVFQTTRIKPSVKPPEVVAAPAPSAEFTQAFNNGLPLTYRVELLPDGGHVVKVRDSK